VLLTEQRGGVVSWLIGQHLAALWAPCDLLVELLTSAGYAAVAASNTSDAFALIRADAPALLLLDTQLPQMSAPELIAQLQATGVTDMPIVLMSTLPRDVELGVPGAAICIAKPFHIDDMLASVAKYVQPSDASTQLFAT
jgi:DNA-binding response OmpR family regulator